MRLPGEIREDLDRVNSGDMRDADRMDMGLNGGGTGWSRQWTCPRASWVSGSPPSGRRAPLSSTGGRHCLYTTDT